MREAQMLLGPTDQSGNEQEKSQECKITVIRVT